MSDNPNDLAPDHPNANAAGFGGHAEADRQRQREQRRLARRAAEVAEYERRLAKRTKAKG